MDDFDTQIQCEEYYDGSSHDRPYEDDEEDMLETQHDMDAILDDEDEDLVDLEDDVHVDDLFDGTGGLTADAYAMLAEMDSAGAFNS